jgi:ADP-ribose pyrophosphatase YjhB (NUDIX family)
MIKITSTGKTIRLISNYKLSEPNSAFISVEVLSKEEMSDFYNILIHSNEIDEIRFFNKDEDKLLEWFKSMFKIVEAAGGVVKNPHNEYLFIFRNGKWDLPKGKIEKNEQIKEAALREVEEECGISNLKIIKELPTTYHTYTLDNKAILKPTYWFEMASDDSSILVPQQEEGITDVEWIKTGDIKKVRENTYGSILDLMEEIRV